MLDGSGGVEKVGGEWMKMKGKKGKRDRKIPQEVENSTDSDTDRQVKSRKMENNPGDEEFKVIFKVRDGKGSFGSISPLKLSSAINQEIGDIRHAKTMANGMLMIICKSSEQQKKACKVKNLNGKGVEGFIPGNNESIGVIYNVSFEITEEDLKSNLKGGKVTKARRLGKKQRDDGRESSAVMLTFMEETLPEKVMLGYLCFRVKKYERPPLRCFNCQRFGHVAVACKGKRRCGKCSEDHDFKECKSQIKCCNCGGSHVAAFRGCPVHAKAEAVQKMRDENKLSYAEALKRIERTSVGHEVGVVKQQQMWEKTPDDDIVIKKAEFLAFFSEAVWRIMERAKNKSDVAREVVAVADRFLGIKDIQPEMLYKYMHGGLTGSQQAPFIREKGKSGERRESSEDEMG